MIICITKYNQSQCIAQTQYDRSAIYEICHDFSLSTICSTMRFQRATALLCLRRRSAALAIAASWRSRSISSKYWRWKCIRSRAIQVRGDAPSNCAIGSTESEEKAKNKNLSTTQNHPHPEKNGRASKRRRLQVMEHDHEHTHETWQRSYMRVRPYAISFFC